MNVKRPREAEIDSIVHGGNVGMNSAESSTCGDNGSGRSMCGMQVDTPITAPEITEKIVFDSNSNSTEKLVQHGDLQTVASKKSVHIDLSKNTVASCEKINR